MHHVRVCFLVILISCSLIFSEGDDSSPVKPVKTTIKAPINSTVSLGCIVPENATSIHWLKNGTEIQINETHKVHESNHKKLHATTLTIESIQSDDFDTYQCTANISDTIQSANITLEEKVKRSPSDSPVKAIKTKIKAFPKSSALLKCKFNKKPSSVSWWKGDDKVNSDSRHVIKVFINKNGKVIGTALKIKILKKKDFGMYKCLAKISGKKRSASIKLVKKKSKSKSDSDSKSHSKSKSKSDSESEFESDSDSESESESED